MRGGRCTAGKMSGSTRRVAKTDCFPLPCSWIFDRGDGSMQYKVGPGVGGEGDRDSIGVEKLCVP